MAVERLPELWHWSEYYCPWSYITAVRLSKVMPEYAGRVKLRHRPFPLELRDHQGPTRAVLQQEWWLAALQEPAAAFAPYDGDDWPETTLPAFEAAWAAFEQGEAEGFEYDLRVRRAFFAGGRNIGRQAVLLEVAREAGLNMAWFAETLKRGEAHSAVMQAFEEGQNRYHVQGTPTLMLPDGTALEAPLAEPEIVDRRVVGVNVLPCCGEDCLQATRALFERALRDHGSPPGQ